MSSNGTIKLISKPHSKSVSLIKELQHLHSQQKINKPYHMGLILYSFINLALVWLFYVGTFIFGFVVISSVIAFNKLALRQSCKLFFTVDGKKYHGYRQRTRREGVNSFRNIITEL